MLNVLKIVNLQGWGRLSGITEREGEATSMSNYMFQEKCY